MSKEKRIVLTEWGCLYGVLRDHNINIDHISGEEGPKIVEEFMEAMCNAGYVAKAKEKKGRKKK